MKKRVKKFSLLAFHQKSITLPVVVIVEKMQKTVRQKREKVAAFLFDAVGIYKKFAYVAAGHIGSRKTLRRGICVDRVRKVFAASDIEFKRRMCIARKAQKLAARPPHVRDKRRKSAIKTKNANHVSR